MKKVIVFLAIFVLLLSFNVNADRKGKNDINNECRAFGFDFGVVKWKWEKKQWWEWGKKEWNSEGDKWDTSVTGTHNTANWDAGTLDDFGATGVVVKSGKDRYLQSGPSGEITEDNPIEQIIFCFKPECGLGGAPGG